MPAAYLSWEVMPNQLWLGIGVGAPFGLKTEWDSSWMGRFHAIESEVKTININPSIAWKVNEMFSVGGRHQRDVHRRELTQRGRIRI